MCSFNYKKPASESLISRKAKHDIQLIYMHIAWVLLVHTTTHHFECSSEKRRISMSLGPSDTMKIKPFAILTRADVTEFIDFFLNSEEEEVLQYFLLLLLSLHPKKLQVMIF